MQYLYSEQELLNLREGGRRLALIMVELEKFVVPGISVHDIEMKTRELILEQGATSATIGYVMDGADPFPSAVCVSVNDEVVHGIALHNKRVLESGDIVSVDVVIIYQHMYIDVCRTWGVGEISPENKELLRVARKVTDVAISNAVIGNTVDDIGLGAQKTAREAGMYTVRELGGHGVGRSIHTSPFIPNFGNSIFRDKIQEGMVLAIEPIVSLGDKGVFCAEDGWLFKTRDGSITAQFEETVLVTKEGPEILTRL